MYKAQHNDRTAIKRTPFSGAGVLRLRCRIQMCAFTDLLRT